VAAQRTGAKPADEVEDLRGAELQGVGMDAATVQAWLASQVCEDEDEGDEPATDTPLAVWPENWPVLQLFLALQTQWRFTPMGALQGLRYDAAEQVMRLRKVRKPRRLFGQLQEMEQAALEAWDE
jgi:hypothetical protein